MRGHAREVEIMEKKIENLKWTPRWVSHLGCIKGCLDYLKMDVSDAWLYGATGHAFIINIHEVVCPSGPTAWKTEMLFKLGKNIGYSIEGDFSNKTKSDFAKVQEHAWNHTRQAIDKGLPCYGWELGIPEYYVVNGYNDQGYFYSGPKGPQMPYGEGTKPWNELGKTDIGVLEMYAIRPTKKADDVKTVNDAFGYVLEHSKSPKKWIYPKYKAGLNGFDLWINALESGKADSFGMAYNSAVWAECRGFAVQFLKEARERLDTKYAALFNEAITHYEQVAQNLKKLSETFPFPPMGGEVKNAARCKTGLEYLRDARKAEEAGLAVLENIHKQL
jgi:hypothetical protein